MTTATKMVRWGNLEPREMAEQFTSRGQERTARNDLRSTCSYCDKAIAGGDNYFEVNGAKFAHKTCVEAGQNGTGKQRRVVTHKMMEAVSTKKIENSKTKVAAKRGRKPKSHAPKAAALKTVSNEVAVEPKKRGRKPKAQNITTQQKPAPILNLSEVREALPGAIVTLTITGTVEAVQRALDKLQN